MSVDHITFSRSGGAGRVAERICAGQSELGFDASLQTVIDTDLWREPFSLPAHTVAAMLDNFAIRADVEKTPTSLFRGNLSSLSRIAVRETSVLHLHWVEGVLTVEEILKLTRSGRQIVWTMHDMIPMTGFCHHSHECQNFEDSCQNCPQARRPFRGLVSNSLDSKLRLRETSNRLQIAVPSEWMKDKVRASAIFRNHDVTVIPNPVSNSMLVPASRKEARSRLGIRDEEFVGVSIAEQLDDPSKCVKETVETFFRAMANLDLRGRYILIGSGGHKLATRFDQISLLGKLSSQEISQVAPAADVAITMSEAESSGMTVVEAGLMGVLPIARRTGGLVEQIDQGNDGYLCTSFADLESVLMSTMVDRTKAQKMALTAKTTHLATRTSSKAAQSYINLYDEFRN
jgi:glycosyltransferase involved in cell wall biosynthesis